jgi:hypothetical protein
MDDRICELAARHLVRLGVFLRDVLVPRSQDGGPELAAAVRLLERASQLGVRAVRTLGLVLPPPPDTLRHGDDAELLASLRPERLDIALATVRARLKRRASRMDTESIDPRAAARLDEGRARWDRACGARLLMRSQEPADLGTAREALAQALTDSHRSFLPDGGGFGTDDAVALLLALWELDVPSSGTVRLLSDTGEETTVSVEDAGDCEFDAAENIEGFCWVTWRARSLDDLTDPSAPIPFDVHLRAEGQRATRFSLGDFIEVHISLGDPARGHGYEHGDWIEVHLPPALMLRAHPLGDVEKTHIVDDGGRRIRVELAGAHGCVIHTRAVMATGDRVDPVAQRFAAGLRNVYDPQRGCGMTGLDVTVFPQRSPKGGGLLGLFRS